MVRHINGGAQVEVVELDMDAAAAMVEWYVEINTCGIYKKFYTCSEHSGMTSVEMCVTGAWNKDTRQEHDYRHLGYKNQASVEAHSLPLGAHWRKSQQRR